MKRVGLFVGIDKYKNGISQLRYAVNDALQLSVAFGSSGFAVKHLFDEKCDSNAISLEVESMVKGLKAGDIFVFYFSGHGRELNGVHYLACINSYPESDLHDADAYPLARLIALTNKISGLHRFFILDCCRSNILADKAGAYFCASSRDLALDAAVEQETAAGIVPPLILNSCSTGEQAFEDAKTEHGFFTKTLLESIKNKKIHTFYQFQKSLKISGTPRPQNISWCGNINNWDKVPLFKSWETEELSEEECQRVLEYEINSLKDELADLFKKSHSAKSHEVERLLENARQAEEKKDYAVVKLFLQNAVNRHISDEKEAAERKQKAAEELRKAEEERRKAEEERRKAEEKKRKKQAGIDAKALRIAINKDIVFNDDSTILVNCPENVAVCKIPCGVTTIGPRAFADCKNLKEVTIPKSVTVIENNAFSGCLSLLEIKIPGNAAIGKRAFAECRSLRKVKISDRVSKIDESAFCDCENLEKIKIPGSISMIGERAFSGCKSLKKVTLSNGVAFIGKSAFSGCEKLKKIAIPNSVKKIDASAFSQCNALKIVNFPAEIENLEEDLFYGCESVFHVAIPENFSWRRFEIIGINEFEIQSRRKAFACKTVAKFLLFFMYFVLLTAIFCQIKKVRIVPADWARMMPSICGGVLPREIVENMFPFACVILIYLFLAIVFAIVGKAYKR